MANNKISLSIAGLNILVTTPEDEEYVTQVAQEIDADINTILESASSASVTNAILLCTIDYLDSYKKANRTSNNMRSQIKDYMAEAANAKREFDAERKRTEELTSEIQALRNHMTRIATEGDTSGVFHKLREDYNSVTNELAKQRKRGAELTSQNKILTEKAEAMNTYIAGQDREIARMTAVVEELNTRLVDKTEHISELSNRLEGYESRVTELLTETERLRSELDILAVMIDEDHEQQQIANAARTAITNLDDNAAAGSKPADLKKDFEPDDTDSPAAFTDPDLDDAITLLDDKNNSPSGRSIKDYDIDINDIPTPELPDPEPASSDAFSDFTIEKDENILGFDSLRRQIEVSEKEKAPEEQPQKPAEQPDDPAKKLNSYLTDMIESEEKKMPFITNIEIPKKPDRGDDDAMPNLSWTLDI